MGADPSEGSAALLFRELCAAAERLGVTVRVEPFDPPALSAGGLCSLHGATLVLLDLRASPDERLWALARALAGLDVDAVYVAPAARELIERARRRANDLDPC